MKLTEALQIIQKIPQDAPIFQVLLGCGCTPLHLQTFLTAWLQKLRPDRHIVVTAGLYGDLIGTVSKLQNGGFQAAAIALEWCDLDPRLGFRQLGGWAPTDLADILRTVNSRLEWLQQVLEQAPKSTRIAISLPTLPLPPVFFTPAWRADPYQIQLEQSMLALAAWAVSQDNIQIVSRQRIDTVSGLEGRFDLKSELLTGLPYPLAHASTLGEALARLIVPSAPKKGLITDLDDTLWQGIVGEIGHESVCWDLNKHAQIHGLYQQLLSALAQQGVLIAVASKNDPQIVAQAFERNDLLLPKERIFPLEIHWNRKSESVGRILETWNIGADSIVFVDDSPMELDEVKTAHPAVECILFPKNNYPAAYRLMYQLRDMFAKERLSEEDTFRLESIRTSATLRQTEKQGSNSSEKFLSDAGATLSFEFGGDSPRILELVNKTNQFNLNGIRYTEAEWESGLQAPGAFVVSANYQDKYGALGTIAVLRGTAADGHIHVDTWVMSCRAFSRRIEHQCMKLLFDRFVADDMSMRFEATAKNGPLQDFLRSLVGDPLESKIRISRTIFEENCPPLYHEVNTTEWTTLSNG